MKKASLLFSIIIVAAISFTFFVPANSSPSPKAAPRQPVTVSSKLVEECTTVAAAHVKALEWKEKGITIVEAANAPENQTPVMDKALTTVYGIRPSIAPENLKAIIFKKCLAVNSGVVDYSFYHKNEKN